LCGETTSEPAAIETAAPQAASRKQGRKYSISFLPTNFPTISAEVLAPRKKLIAAIGNYAQALGAASDPATIQDLQDAATSLATTVGTAASPFLGPAATPIITLVARLVGRGFGLAVENTYAPEIYAVMQRADPDVVVAASLLKESIAIIARHDRDALTAWSTEK